MVSVWGPKKPVANLKPEDFGPLKSRLSVGQDGKSVRPKTVHNLISRCRTVLNFAYKNAKVDHPIRGGTYFERPSADEIRKDQAAQDHLGRLDLESQQIRDVLELASPQMEAMILLAINTGMGNEDCARLEFRHIDLETGWLEYPRPKTGVKRIAKLWGETVQALKKTIDGRKEPKDSDLNKYVFVTKYGQCWFNETRANPISAEFRKLLKKAGHHVTGKGFYSLRRTFETIAGEAKDQPAVDLSMGHQSPEMSALYRQKVQHHRMESISRHVRNWLFRKVYRERMISVDEL